MLNKQKNIFKYYMFVEKTSNYSQELKEKRESLGLSLADLFQRTRISVAYLQAIENGDFHLLPVSVYTKNFIRTYARALGVESESILTNYENYLNSQKGIQPQPAKDTTEKKNIFAGIVSRKTYLVAASVIIIVGMVIWLISKQYQSSSDIVNSTGSVPAVVSENKVQTENSALNAATVPIQNQQGAAKLEQSKINEQKKDDKQTGTTKIENISLISKNVESVVNNKDADLLVVNAVEDTWIRIKTDESPSFEIFLKAGEKFERKAANVKMDIGNAGGIRIQFKDKKMENLGKSGQVVHLQLP